MNSLLYDKTGNKGFSIKIKSEEDPVNLLLLPGRFSNISINLGYCFYKCWPAIYLFMVRMP